MRLRRATPPAERGFTLIEVMVAISLMSLILMSGGAFMIRSMFTASSLVGRQAAIAVANGVLEEVRAVDPTVDAQGISPLVYGRQQSDVVAQWRSAANVGVDTGLTYTGEGSSQHDATVYDPGDHPVGVPLTRTIVNGPRSFEVSVLIGACLRNDVGTECAKGTTGALLLRVIALVRWPTGNDGCPSEGCAYSSGTLIDPTADPQFNSSRRPVANPDGATTRTNTAVDIPVVFNDSGVFALYGAITVITPPANGSLSVYPTNNIVKYTPRNGFAGTDFFAYKVADTSNRVSDVAVVTVVVSPLSLPTSIGGLLG